MAVVMTEEDGLWLAERPGETEREPRPGREGLLELRSRTGGRTDGRYVIIGRSLAKGWLVDGYAHRWDGGDGINSNTKRYVTFRVHSFCFVSFRSVPFRFARFVRFDSFVLNHPSIPCARVGKRAALR